MCLHACARSLSPPHQHSHMVSANQTMSPPPRPAPQPHSVLPTGKPGCRERHTRSKGSEAGSAVVWGHSFWKKTAICPSEGFRAPSWWRQPSWSGKAPGAPSGEGVRSAVQEHPLPVGTEGWLERPVVQRWGKGHRTLSSQSQRGWGPGRREIPPSKLDRTTHLWNNSQCGQGGC